MTDSTQTAVDEFWRWIQAHIISVDLLEDSSAPFWDEVLYHLQRIDRRLRFEVSKPAGGHREFIVTAEGHVDAFPVVEALVAHAPVIKGWQFIALKPPMGFDFVTTYEAIQFDPKSMWFVPLKSPSRPRELGLRVGILNYSSEIVRQASNALLVILDTALGERSAAQDIQHIEVVPLPDSPESQGFIELQRLASYIQWHERQNSNA